MVNEVLATLGSTAGAPPGPAARSEGMAKKIARAL